MASIGKDSRFEVCHFGGHFCFFSFCCLAAISADWVVDSTKTKGKIVIALASERQLLLTYNATRRLDQKAGHKLHGRFGFTASFLYPFIVPFEIIFYSFLALSTPNKLKGHTHKITSWRTVSNKPPTPRFPLHSFHTCHHVAFSLVFRTRVVSWTLEHAQTYQCEAGRHQCVSHCVHFTLVFSLPFSLVFRTRVT